MLSATAFEAMLRVQVPEQDHGGATEDVERIGDLLGQAADSGFGIRTPTKLP